MRLQTLAAAVLVATVATYLMVGRGDAVLTTPDLGSVAVAGTRPPSPIGQSPERVLVHVSGAVVSPGIVEIAQGARVADAIAAAGGATRDAELSAINLAAPIGDGDQLVVPEHGVPAGAPVSGSPGSSGPDGSGRLHLNTATRDQLMELPGIGPVLAERIMRHREEHGPFTAIEDLLDVAGIGEAKLVELRALVEL